MFGGRASGSSHRRAVRVRAWLLAARTRARIAVFVGVFVVANLMGMSAAVGDGEGNSGGSSVWRWMDVNDSNGTSAWGYTMSLDYGGMTDVGNAVFGGVTGLCWFFYQWFVIASIWLINFALSMEWFEPLKAPAAHIADSLQVILGQVQLAPMLLAITAAAIGLLIMRGAWATAIFEVIVTMVVLALGTGVFSDPVDKTIGNTDSQQVVDSASDSGWLAQATGAGLELAGGLQQAKFVGSSSNTGGFDDPDAVREDISGQLVDTFLRTPHQLINYGKSLDGTSCEGAYNQSLLAGSPPPQPSYVKGDPNSEDGVTIDSSKIPSENDSGWDEWATYRDWLTQGSSDDVDLLDQRAGDADTFPWPTPTDKEPREIVGDCDEAAGDHADNPSPGMAGDAATMGIGVIFLVGLAAVMAFTLILIGVEFLWCALRSIWDFIIGLLPGNSRSRLWQTLSTAVWCLVGAAFTSIFLVTYLLVLNEVATSIGDDSVMGAFALVDILMLVGVILFWRLRKQMRSAAARTADLLSKRPNPNTSGKPPGWVGAPSKMPSNGSSTGMGAAAMVAATRAKGIGQSAAVGTSRATKVGASGIGKAALVGGAGAGGGLLLAAGVAYRGSRRLGQRISGADEANAAAAAAAANGGRPHGSREAFADERGLRANSGKPEDPDASTAPPVRPRMQAKQSARRAAMAQRLKHFPVGQKIGKPTPQTPPSQYGPDTQGRKYARFIKNGQVVLEPVDNRSQPTPPRRASPPPQAQRGQQTRSNLAKMRSWAATNSVEHGPRFIAWGGAVGTAYTSPSPNIVAAVATAGFAADMTSDRIRKQWRKKRDES